MTLFAGTRLGPYEILAALGAGGMGEVYRARDSKLGRDVALKVLPEEFFEDADRVGRFEREAKALAALNHPGIATIHAFEEISGRHILAMELVEGEGPDVRIAAGAIPLDEALSVARQIAEALEAAHEKGIIHRDLKPANVKMTPDGKVKLLDFGLAKIFEGDPTGGSSPSLTHSPTVTGRATAAGIILGTAAYMSPEQARGKTVDKRTDIWAFGCVLYEMLTGRRLFHGEDVSETLASVLRADLDWNALPAGTAPATRRLLLRCLERDPRRRLRHIGDAVIEIDEALAGPSPYDRTSATVTALPRAWQRPSVLAAGALLLAGLSGVAAWVLKPLPDVARPITRFTLALPPSQNLSGLTRRAVAVSPDGTRIAYIANESLFVRDLGSAEPRVLVSPAMDLVFSPDGEWLAFTHRGSLSKIRVSGGAPETLLPNVIPMGTSWADDGTIVFADPKGLQRVPEAGGRPELLFASNPPVTYSWPQVLPGGRFVLYSESPNGMINQGVTVVRALDGSDRRVVLQNSFGAQYADSGHLVYAEVRLMAVPFDLASRRASGTPVQLAEGVRFSPVTGASQFAFSKSGTLVHTLAGADLDTTQLVWVDRDGKASPASRTLRVYSDLRLSRDGQRLAMHLQDEANDVWISDLSRGTFTRLTFEPTEDETPVWSPDNRQVAYAASRTGQKRGVYRRAADGGSAEELLDTSDQHSHVMDWTPDGLALLVEFSGSFSGSATGSDLMLLDLEARQFRPLIQTRFNERFGRFSPDGKWLAYSSDESGRDEIYVQPFPSLNARVQVSTDGGVQPVWSLDGSELFYRAAQNVIAATVKSRAPLTFAPPRVLFADRFERPQAAGHVSYDVAPDGRFLMIAAPEGRAGHQSEIHVVLNWFEELRRLAKAGR